MLYWFKKLITKYLSFLKYSATGCINTFLSVIAYYLFLKLGIHYLAANAMAYCIGMLNSFILNKLWVFRSLNAGAAAFWRFILLNVATLLSSSAMLILLIDVLHIGKLFAQITTTAAVLLVGYTINKSWTFKITAKNS